MATSSTKITPLRRNVVVQVRVTDEEFAHLRSIAEDKEITVSALVREHLEILKASKVKPATKLRPTRKADPALIGALGRIGNNLNQIARWANRYKSSADAIDVVSALMKIEHFFSLLPQLSAKQAIKKEATPDDV